MTFEDAIPVLETDTASAYSEIVGSLSDLDPTGSRGGETREELMVSVASDDPRRRHLFRDGYNLVFALQECWAYWVGANPGHVERYNPNMDTWIDDETGELPGSAYGDRLVNTAGHDQIKRAYEQIDERPLTRRALMAVHQPAVEDYDSNDVACTAHLQPYLRDDELHMVAVVRSQDMYWGYPYDSHNNQWIQCMMAGMLGVEPGDYYHVMQSCHYYTEHEEQALEAASDHEVADAPRLRLSGKELENEFGWLSEALADLRDGEVPIASDEVDFESPFFADWYRLVAAYESANFRDDLRAATIFTADIEHEPWRRWMGRRL